MKWATTTAVAILLLVVAACAQQQPNFIIGFVYPNSTTPYPGYELASIADLQTANFAAQYNAIGLPYVTHYFGSICCVVSVAEGFLSFGPTTTDSNFIESFGANGVDTCTSGTMPINTTFGVPTFMVGPYQGLWLSNISSKEQSSLRVTGLAPPASYTECTTPAGPSNSYPVVYKLTSVPPPPSTTAAPATAQFMVSPSGPSYPAPAGYSVAFVSDIASSAFQSFYNGQGGILLTGSGSTNYCCMIQVADGGWLSYGPEGLFSPVSLSAVGTGYWSCNQASNNLVHWFGTSFGGPDNGINFPTLNNTIVRNFGYFVNNTADWDGCIGLPNSLTLYKQN